MPVRPLLLEGHAGRQVIQRPIRPYGDELRVCAEADGAEDAVTDRELADGCANSFDLSGQLAAEDPPPRPTPAGEVAGDERLRAAPAAIRSVDSRGVDPDEDQT